jgi:hypothetical protein
MLGALLIEHRITSQNILIFRVVELLEVHLAWCHQQFCHQVQAHHTHTHNPLHIGVCLHRPKDRWFNPDWNFSGICQCVRFEASAAVSFRSAIFWDVAWCWAEASSRNAFDTLCYYIDSCYKAITEQSVCLFVCICVQKLVELLTLDTWQYTEKPLSIFPACIIFP